MAIKNYMINDKWLDIAKQNIVEVKSTDGVIGSVKVNGQEYGGGGGSSDFSTAQVTLETSSEFVEGVNLSCIQDDGVWVYSDPDTGVYTVPLFNGINNIQLTRLGMNVNVSGSAEMRGAFVRVTGDCTITVS